MLAVLTFNVLATLTFQILVSVHCHEKERGEQSGTQVPLSSR
jgi:hypothetical protein